MAIIHKRVTIGTTPTLITTGTVGASWVTLHAPSGGNTIYIGDTDVTTSTGLELPKGALHTIWIAEADKLYGVVANSTEVIMVFSSGSR